MAVLTGNRVFVGRGWIAGLLRAVVATVALVGIALPCHAKADARAAIAAAQALGPEGIQELRSVEIGGIPQWISIRGSDRSNPILLFVHGGPGSPMMPLSWTFQRPWED